MQSHTLYLALLEVCEHYFNSLRSSDAIWCLRTLSTLVQVMACCLMAPNITWTNVELSSVRSIDIHLRAISPEVLQLSITKISLKITPVKLSPGSMTWNLHHKKSPTGLFQYPICLSYHKILQRLQPNRLVVKLLLSLWNLAGISVSVLLWCLINCLVIEKH